MKTVVTAVLAVVATAIAFALLPGSGDATPSAQGQDVSAGPGFATVQLWPDVRRDPVKVIKIAEGGKPIVPGVFVKPQKIFGKPFAVGDDWINNLSFVLKNFTSQKIALIWIVLGFHHGDREVWHDNIEWDLELGQVPDLAAASDFKRPREVIMHGTGHSLEFGPGQEMTIPLSDLADAIKAKIESITPFSEVTACIIRVERVYFEDQGMRWDALGWGYRIPDADSPEGYRSLDAGYFPGDLNQTTGEE